MPIKPNPKGGPRRIHDLVRSLCPICGDESRTPDGAEAACPKCSPVATPIPHAFATQELVVTTRDLAGALLGVRRLIPVPGGFREIEAS